MLRIMFDLHGVIESFPEIYKPLMKTMRDSGHYVIICSGPRMSKIMNELEVLGYIQDVHYDKVISIEDYLSSQGIIFKYDNRGNPWTDDKIWFCSKGQIAKIFNVNLVIDNSIQYKDCMPDGVQFLLLV